MLKWLGVAGGKTPGSRWRRRFTRSINLLTLLGLLALFGKSEWISRNLFTNWQSAVGLIVFSVVYFTICTVGVLRLSSNKFTPSAMRLISDIGNSALFAIVSFALAYESLGISATFQKDFEVTAFENVYFSTVTFST